jgi:chorismate mutase / prephenate dehydratase
MPERRDPGDRAETAELRRLRRRIDALDRRIVALMSDRARLGLAVGEAKSLAGRRGVFDADREREVLLRVAMANPGPLPQSELLAVYRRLILATRRLEASERRKRTGRRNGPRERAATEPSRPDPQPEPAAE